MNSQQAHVIKNQYVVERVLGNGGFGRVYLAYDRQHQRRCAIKEIRIEGPVDHNFVLHEIRTLEACAAWPFVPTIYDAFFQGSMDDQTGYVVMEYIEGSPLGRIRPWTGAQIAHLLDAMLANLAQLHARGFVHRDIKPDNILLTPQGTYALVDFGIAKSGTHTRSIIHPVLTPQFAAPEQFQGLGTDNRSDLYSLGATAYLLLTGTSISAWDTKQRAQQLASLRHSGA
jgi:serine/threonine-protein kinase